MNLNLPIFDRVADCKNILIAGMGGGFDIFCGLPIYFELKARGLNVHLANYSFSYLEDFQEGTRLTKSLVGVTAGDGELFMPYFPERYLSQWFREKRGEEVPIWSFQKLGVRPLLNDYQTLVNHLNIDCILLIDGGVDSLMHGDEAAVGTIVEDTISLVAVGELKDVPVKLTVCVGMGAEQDMYYPATFENIAELAAVGAFLGSCSLTKHFSSYQAYEDAVLFVQSRSYQDPSVINSSIVSAVQGKHGDYHLTQKTKNSQLSISPLMAIFWFFELTAVAERNLFYSHIGTSETFHDALRSVMFATHRLNKRALSRNRLG